MRKQFDTTQNWTAGEGSGELRMDTPTRPAGFVSDLVVPFGQALITGGLLAGLITFVIGRTDYSGDLGPLWLGLTLAIGTITWVMLLADTRRLLRQIETLTGLDLDGDGKAGNPQDRMVLVNAPQARKEAQQIVQERDQADTAAELAEFVARLPALGTDARTWESRIGRDKYVAFRGVLLEMGWAAWNSPRDKRRGWSLVLPVREILQRITTE